ncbi:MAG: primosomal protein N' [Candidatus Paceibacterota bacterium]|jgi:primosomal protein N'
MKIVEIIPISKGLFKDHLTYFSNQEIKPGMLVEAPIKNKTVMALVSSVKEVENLKSQIKNSDFSIKKLGPIKNKIFFLPEFLATAIWAAEFFACPIGQVIKEFIPKIILENSENIKINVSKNNTIDTISEIQASQAPDEERWSFYKGLIRETFAKKQSVFWCLPSVAEINNIQNFISRGIEQYVIVLHNKLSKKELLAAWKKAIIIEHPVLIIATPMFLSLPRQNIKILILDKENSSSYKNYTRPFLDFRRFAENYAKHRKIRLIFGDTVLQSEIIYRLGTNEITSVTPLKYRFYTEIKQVIAKLNKTDSEKMAIGSLSQELGWLIENNRDRNERLFIFSGQRGLAPLTICRDCQTVVTCDVCGTPLDIHKKILERQTNRIFICHHCSKAIEIDDTCKVCGGSRLAVLGYGIEKIEEDIKTLLPDINIFRLDSDSISNSKKAAEIAQKFFSSSGGVLLGTEMALPYLSEKIENIAIAGIDTFFALPDFRISEKMFSLLLRLRSKAARRFLIQTGNPEEKIFEYVLAGNLLDFFREEIAERKKLGYPPFKTLIKISLVGRSDMVKREMKKLADELEKYKPLVFPTLTGSNKGYEQNLLLKLEPKDWPNLKLLETLRSLPPSFVIEVDPKKIL